MAKLKVSNTELMSGEVLRLTGLSKKELHALDDLGILHPEAQVVQGIRRFNDQTLMRIEQFNFYEERQIPLEVTREILANPGLQRANAVLDAQWMQLYSELDALTTRIACIEACQVLDLAGKTVPWGALTRLQRNLPGRDLNFWDAFQPDTRGKDSAFGNFDQIWSLYQTWKRLLISGALYEKAGVLPDEPLAMSLGLERLNWRREVESIDQALVERFKVLETSETWLRQVPFETLVEWFRRLEIVL